MKHLVLISSLAALSFFSLNLFGQCSQNPPLSFTYTTTPSICSSDGTITLHITGGLPFTDNNGNPIYRNRIINSFNYFGQSDTTMSLLEAGTHVVQVTDAEGCAVTQQVTVPGNYQDLGITINVEDAVCDGSQGGSICATAQNGVPGYTYSMFGFSNNQNGCFTNLAQGTYRLIAFDSCGNNIIRTVKVGIKNYAPSLQVSTNSVFSTCDSMCLAIGVTQKLGPWGEFPYTWEIINSTEPEIVGVTGMFDTIQEIDTLCFMPVSDGNFIIEVTDVCGKTTTLSKDWFGNRPLPSNRIGYDCTSGYWIKVNSTFSEICPQGTVTWNVTSAPAGAPIPPPQDSGLFYGLDIGEYCFEITDCCGFVTTTCLTTADPNWTITASNSYPGCSMNEIRYNLFLQNNGPAPDSVTYVLTVAPFGYTGTVPDTFFNRVTDVYGPPGSYCWLAYDECGRVESDCFQLAPDTLNYSYNIGRTVECTNYHELTFNITSNYNLNVTVTNLETGMQWNAQNGTVLTNIYTGNYEIELYNSVGRCVIETDTLSVDDLNPLYATPETAVSCNGIGLIFINAFGSTPPYTYELWQGPITRALQATPSFPGIPPGDYSVRVFDDCLNFVDLRVSVKPFLPVYQGYHQRVCLGDSVTLQVDYFELAQYSWSGPGGTMLSDSSKLVIPNVSPADTGTYTIDVDVMYPLGLNCPTEHVTVQLETYDCSCTIADFDATMVECFNANDGSLTANVNSVPGGPFTYEWSTGANSQTIQPLSPGYYTVTITDADGCITTGDTIITQPPKLDVIVSISNVGCVSLTDGSATVDATGGVPGYTYQWDTLIGAPATPTVTGLSTGTYGVSITDDNGCCTALSVLVGNQPCPPCELAENGLLDICTVLLANPNHELASLDCDNGGIDNLKECKQGGNPLDASDDCAIALQTNVNICLLLSGNPSSALATQDCDNGGVSNIEECQTGENPTDPSDDCQAALDGGINICQLINYDPNHPLGILDCDNGGIDNYTECTNGGDPSVTSDDCSIVVIEQIDICVLLINEPNNPLGNVDCDGDGVINSTECTEMTDVLDPCLFNAGSITLPVTADQSGCLNLCTDLTPITTILPGNIAGVSNVEVAVKITELNGIDTDGSGVLVRMPSDPRLVFTWDPVLTIAALVPVNNSVWNYLGDNGFVHTFQFTGPGNIILGGQTEAFGFQSVYDPQSTDGQTTITATIIPLSGGECNILNDTDSERMVYFE